GDDASLREEIKRGVVRFKLVRGWPLVRLACQMCARTKAEELRFDAFFDRFCPECEARIPLPILFINRACLGDDEVGNVAFERRSHQDDKRESQQDDDDAGMM